MERMLKSQTAKILLLLSFLSLLLLVPFISTSLRSSYLYFLFNLLIIALGVEAGLLASISRPHVDVVVVEKKPVLAVVCSSSPAAREAGAASCRDRIGRRGEVEGRTRQEAVVTAPVEKLLRAERKKAAAEAAERAQRLKRCRSRPSIFFIGSCDEEEDHHRHRADQLLLQQKQQEQVVVGAEEYSAGDHLSKQELFMKAEMFIGNFYKQLKMQREESWKKIHGLYHRAFE